MFNYLTSTLIPLLFSLPAVLIALTFHEFAHGYMAYKLGDNTALYQGRLSLNPLHHLDPIGFLCMLLFRFGWARPVPINARNFKNPKRDTALTALAGPVANLLLGFIGIILYHAVLRIILAVAPNPSSDFTYYLQYFTLQFLGSFFSLNICLAVFNLFPVPPLDGSRIFLSLLPAKYYFGVMKYERYISLALMLLLIFGFLNTPLSIIVNYIIRGMEAIVNLIPFLRI